MKKFLLLILAFLILTPLMKADPPDCHPAVKLRMYYADIYTGSSIVCYESSSVDSVLFIVERCVEKAQCISVYSYKDSPYNFNYNGKEISLRALEKAPMLSSDSRRYFLSRPPVQRHQRPNVCHW